MSKKVLDAQGAISLLNGAIARKYKTGAIRFVDAELAEGVIELELDRAWIERSVVSNINEGKAGRRPLLKMGITWSSSCPLEDAGTSFSVESNEAMSIGQSIDMSQPIFFKKKFKEVHFEGSWYPEFRLGDNGKSQKIEPILDEEGHIVDFGYVEIPTKYHPLLGATNYIKCSLNKSVVAPLVRRTKIVASKM